MNVGRTLLNRWVLGTGVFISLLTTMVVFPCQADISSPSVVYPAFNFSTGADALFWVNATAWINGIGNAQNQTRAENTIDNDNIKIFADVIRRDAEFLQALSEYDLNNFKKFGVLDDYLKAQSDFKPCLEEFVLLVKYVQEVSNRLSEIDSLIVKFVEAISNKDRTGATNIGNQIGILINEMTQMEKNVKFVTLDLKNRLLAVDDDLAPIREQLKNFSVIPIFFPGKK